MYAVFALSSGVENLPVAGLKTPLKLGPCERGFKPRKEGDRDFSFADFVQSLADGDEEDVHRSDRAKIGPNRLTCCI